MVSFEVAGMQSETAGVAEDKVKLGHLTLKHVRISGTRHEMQSLADAISQDYVYADWGSAFARFHAKRFGERVTPVLRTNIGQSAREFIIENGGAAYLPPTLVKSTRKRLYRVAGAPSFKRRIHAAYLGLPGSNP